MPNKANAGSYPFFHFVLWWWVWMLPLCWVGCGRRTAMSADRTGNYTEKVKGVSFTMVKVEGGNFEMGCTEEQLGICEYDEKPTHEVTLSDYNIGETEVTQGLWRAVMGENPSRFEDCDECPVEKVTWEDVQVFIRKLNKLTGKNYRLPTEAEWEYAARGGKRSGRFVYSGSSSLNEVAWIRENSEGATHAVKGKKANELGLYDMSGNVWEWCGDWYGENFSGSQTNPMGPEEGFDRVIRGGSWSNDPQYCRVSARIKDTPDFLSNDLGFRLASQ